MSYTKTPGKTLNQAENCYSDGTELVSAEVQANTRHDEAQLIDTPFAVGYRADLIINRMDFTHYSTHSSTSNRLECSFWTLKPGIYR